MSSITTIAPLGAGALELAEGASGQVGTRAINQRVHPLYSTWAPRWEFYTQSYIGGPEYIAANLFQYFKEGNDEFIARVSRAYRENHSKRVVDLVNSYLFKEDAVRQTDNPLLNKVMENLDGKGAEACDYMKSVSQWASVNGRVYIVVDTKKPDEDEATGTYADTLKNMPYCYTVFPQNVLDIAFDDEGEVKWAIIRESYREDDDPHTAEAYFKFRYRLWEKGKWTLYNNAGTQLEEGETGLNCVPIVIVDNEEQDLYGGQSLIGDIAYLDRAIFNNWSRLDTIVCDQTFSQLIFPIEGLSADIISDPNLREQFLTLATNRVLLYSAAAQAQPAFISPDASQAEFVLRMIERQVKQLYSTLGLQAETATETTAASSGVAKAYDFDKLNKLLAGKADGLEHAEKRIYEICQEWLGIKTDVTVEYPDEFDVKSLADEVLLAESLTLLDISKTFNKEVHKIIVQKALPKATQATIDTINKEIDDKADAEELAMKSAAFPFDGQPGQGQMPGMMNKGMGQMDGKMPPKPQASKKQGNTAA